MITLDAISCSNIKTDRLHEGHIECWEIEKKNEKKIEKKIGKKIEKKNSIFLYMDVANN